MATSANTISSDRKAAAYGGTRFFTIMAWIMSLVIVAGFSVNLAMGRSSFDVPLIYHLHAGVFMAWLGIYLGQHMTASAGNWPLHAKFGKIAWVWVPLMIVLGTAVMIVVAQRTGGPFFFHASEFLWSNIMLLWCFGGLTIWALMQRRYTGWHRRLMLCGMAILTGPGVGRLLPMPFMIPYSWTISTAVTMIFPLIGIVADLRRDGKVHPAYLWGLGLYLGTFLLSMVLAYSHFGMTVTEGLLAGTPGAERPMEAFLPPDFTG